MILGNRLINWNLLFFKGTRRGGEVVCHLEHDMADPSDEGSELVERRKVFRLNIWYSNSAVEVGQMQSLVFGMGGE